MTSYIDAHSHWTDPRIFPNKVENLLIKANQEKITHFLLAGIDPDEWKRQIILCQQYPKNFSACFGLHPYFVAANPQETCEEAMDQLADQLAQNFNLIKALGEMGLDFRDHLLLTQDKNHQITFFENQLQLAKMVSRPVVLHIVWAHDAAIKILDIWDAPPKGGFIHAFNGSYELAKNYLNHGMSISIGGAVTWEKNKKLIDCVEKLSMDDILIESDAPDQKPYGFKSDSDLNDSSSVILIAKRISEIKNMTMDDVLTRSANNFKKLFAI